MPPAKNDVIFDRLLPASLILVLLSMSTGIPLNLHLGLLSLSCSEWSGRGPSDIGTTMKFYVGVNAEVTADELWRAVEKTLGTQSGTKSSRGGGRTRTGVTSHWILSPERLPFRHSA
jgi:hypothetical protein